jgi:hypothetical protein
MNIRTAILAAVAAAAGLTACDDDPFQINWEADADTARLFALSRPELNLPSAFDFFARAPLRLESPNTGDQWDVALDVQGTDLVWLPPRSLGVPSEAGMATLEGQTFLETRMAPGDTARYVTDGPIPVRTGVIYVVRTRLVPGAFGTRCTYYGKIEALEVDVAGGQMTFQYDVSPVCNGRELIPPE